MGGGPVIDSKGWCILRTGPSRTLRLAKSLAHDGFEVWTPTETKTVRVPRANVRRESQFALLPSYIFARARHLIDLMELASLPVKPRRGAGLREPAHEDFRLMRCFGGLPIVTDADLFSLRALEAKRTPRPKAQRTFGVGSPVRVDGGIFGGMSGMVEKSNFGHTLVCFGSGRSVKIPTSILRDAALQCAPAAEAA